MSSTNISKILLRSIRSFEATNPLFINLPDSEFYQEYTLLFPEAQCAIFHNNFAIHQQFKRLQYNQDQYYFSACYQTKQQHDLIILQFPKSKTELSYTLAMLAHCTNETTKIFIVGENKGGIKTVEKNSSDYLNFCEKTDSARHCLLYFGTFKSSIKPFNIDDWYKYYDHDINGIGFKIASLPGVFSQNSLDKGTLILLKNLPLTMSGKVLDFGCGAGVISVYIGKKFNEISLSLIDVSALALESAKKTLVLNNLTGNVFATNSLSNVKEKYQFVVSNPPFHQGIKTHYTATENFLEGISKHLTATGELTIVANTFLRYKPIMEKYIGKTITKVNDSGFCVYQCKK